MAAPVDRQKLFEAMADNDPENQYMVDVRTGRVIRLSLKDSAGLQRFKADLAADPKRYVRVPKPSGQERHGDLAEFVASLSDPGLKRRLQGALAGASPFRELRDVLETNFQGKRQWEAFQRRKVEGRLVAFLKTSGLS